MSRLILRWYPPYTNGFKDQPVEYFQEAELMQNWFKQIGVKSEIIRIIETEYLVKQ